jgi:hypothetical protein
MSSICGLLPCSYGRPIRSDEGETVSDIAPTSEPAIYNMFYDFDIIISSTDEYVLFIFKSSDKASRFQCVLESKKLFNRTVL